MKISMRLSKLVAPVLVLASALFGLTVATSAPAGAAVGDRQLTIHYSRPDASYAAWNVWMWNNGGTGEITIDNPLLFNGEDDFGKKMTFNVTDPAVTQLGFIIRTGDWAKEPAETDGVNAGCPDSICNRFIDLNATGTTDVWLISGDPTVYTHNPYRTLTVHYSRPDGAYTPWNLWMWNNGGTGEISIDNPVLFNGEDAFGKKMSMVITDPAVTQLGFIIRTGDWAKEPAETDGVNAGCPDSICNRFIDLKATGDTDIWIVSGDATVYTHNPYRNVTIHYHRDDALYDPWSVWMWNNGPEGTVSVDNPLLFNGDDDFGKKMTFTITDPAVTQLGFIIRTADWAKEPAETNGVNAGCPDSICNRFIDLNTIGDTDVYLMSGDATVYTYDPRGRTVTIHYWRPDADYSAWTLWMWNNGPNGEIGFDNPIEFNGEDAEGASYTFLVTDAAVSQLGFIVRTNDWAKEPAEWDGVNAGCPDSVCNRFIDLTADPVQDIWLKQGISTVFYDNPWGSSGPTSQTATIRLSGITASAEVSLPAKTTASSQIRWMSYTPNVCAIKGGHLLHTYRPGACRIVGNADAVGAARAVTFTRTVTVK